MDHLHQHIEALIFATEHPISREEIVECLETTFESKISKEDIDQVLEELREKFQDDQFAMEIVEIAGGFQFLTKGAYHNSVGNHLRLTTRRQLSRAAIETISIIAYKQPVTKTELEKIRGVNCDYSVQKLLEKDLVTIIGRSDGPGRPLLYGTSDKFMDYFGLKSLQDLPKLKDFKTPDSEIGEPAPVDENVDS